MTATQHALLTLSLIDLALILGATVYESVVIAPNYERDVPTSIDLARQFFRGTAGTTFAFSRRRHNCFSCSA
jgi:hypothetical protein